jgi:succinyl-CoA synthetase alpha subunit
MQGFSDRNTLGALSPGKAVVGMIGGRAESARQWFKARCAERRRRDQSAPAAWHRAPVIISGKPACGFQPIVHIGGDAVIGIRSA